MDTIEDDRLNQHIQKMEEDGFELVLPKRKLYVGGDTKSKFDKFVSIDSEMKPARRKRKRKD